MNEEIINKTMVKTIGLKGAKKMRNIILGMLAITSIGLLTSALASTTYNSRIYLELDPKKNLSDQPAGDIHSIISTSREVLRFASQSGGSTSLKYQKLINECFRPGMIKRTKSEERRTCDEHKANGYYDKPTQMIFLCDKTFDFNLEQAVFVLLHECGHHSFGDSEQTADYYATQALLDYRTLEDSAGSQVAVEPRLISNTSSTYPTVSSASSIRTNVDRNSTEEFSMPTIAAEKLYDYRYINDTFLRQTYVVGMEYNGFDAWRQTNAKQEVADAFCKHVGYTSALQYMLETGSSYMGAIAVLDKDFNLLRVEKNGWLFFRTIVCIKL